MKIYALEWKDTQTGEVSLCEVESGVCYEVHRTEEAAQASADLLNSDARDNGWTSRYRVVELKHGLRPYFGGGEPEPPYNP